ncbi:CYT-19 DEAD-box protein [Taphrina deformans PYCC 5710]|uniref:ATP-dependent RNA helicase n=1 Tax=Taphrina deformans (strain PYCC 5710 / ATCC 11124 / CBS 356.35 / IMI 108563 / JCM 9778 / NBRC 8474) TaxID=1097556 RepID=R4X971_TAPDE|nr:CYT-19 DEAD-box protein [Taphrina deformans PYCC 5710]|eukprot:CCG82261.1 CYT-19 DEAD-box protein [Taphrina deformans PYCC 5710]
MHKIFKYQRVSKVQAAILDLMPIQQDLLVRSKTGTGKTLGFLVPALQRALERFESLGLQAQSLKTYANRNASTLIISPTRELANQISTEARRLMTAPGPGMKALCVVGGDSKRDQISLMRRQRNDFVVATPGRLLDLLENTEEFSDMVKNIHTLVLDEADTLLEMGFRSELEKILKYLPEKRQTYMFSATVSRDIQRIARNYLDRDHKFLNTVSKDEQDSHQLIKQEYIVRPLNEHMKVVLSLIITQQLKNPNVKIIVFLQTTKMTMLYASVFKTLRRLYPNPAFQQFDIHAQRSQDSRTKVSQAFRTANAGSVLFTTDVSARGVDYPGVAQVIQVGSANSRDLYIHRLGRTGRAGKAGEGVLILQPCETEFLRTLGRDIPITEKDFPDSEIELGEAQDKCFKLAYRIPDAELVRDTFSSLSGALLPRARDLRANRTDMIEALKTWFGDFGEGQIPLPQLSARLLGSSGRDSDHRGRFGGDRGSGYGGQDYGRPRRDFQDRSSRGGQGSDWRPKRPSEFTSRGNGFTHKRKDFSVSRYSERSSRRG